jgi:hypothetical protein
MCRFPDATVRYSTRGIAARHLDIARRVIATSGGKAEPDVVCGHRQARG